MIVKRALLWFQSCIVIAAIVSTIWLYLYPVFKGCAFPSTNESNYSGFQDTITWHRGRLHEHAQSRAPFRLLVLADPQLEGDSSLPDPDDALSARIAAYWDRLQSSPLSDVKNVSQVILKNFVFEDIPRAFWTARKTLDLFGNDYYLAHIYRTLHWWTVPTHVTVLGDLIGSQWVSDDEFDWRGWRYWNRVLAGSEPVDQETMTMYQQEKEEQKAVQLEAQDADWSQKIINIVGNHDIGYAGDISESRISRFERVFGKVNWDLHFTYPEHRLPANHSATENRIPSLHLVVLNSMILDTPALEEEIQQQTYTYLNDLVHNRLNPVDDRNSTFILLLTHVPLHKPEGTCVDAPFFEFWDYTDANGAFKNGGLKEQNHLSEHASHSGVLQALFGMSGNLDASAGGLGRSGLILNGHDHAGCDVVHYIERITKQNLEEPQFANRAASDQGNDTLPVIAQSASETGRGPGVSWSWLSERTELYQPKVPSTIIDEDGMESCAEQVTSIREITMRSMMGEFSGNAGLLSLWYDFDANTWRYDIQMCSLGVQHIWWAVHVLDLIAISVALLQTAFFLQTLSKQSDNLPRKVVDGLIEGEDRSRKLLVDRRVENVTRASRHQRSHSERRRKG